MNSMQASYAYNEYYYSFTSHVQLLYVANYSTSNWGTFQKGRFVIIGIWGVPARKNYRLINA